MTREEREQHRLYYLIWAYQCGAELAPRCEEIAPTIEALIDLLDRSQGSAGLRIAFAGRFSAGKTRLVNNILGNRVLLEGMTETTAIPTRVRKGEKERLLLRKFGDWYEASDAERNEFLNLSAATMSPLMRNYLQEQQEVIFEHPTMPGGVEVVDLPGVSSSVQNIEERALRALKFANGIVWVVNAKQGGLTRADLDYIQKNVPQETPLLVVLTHMDLIPPSGRQQILDNAAKSVAHMPNVVGVLGTHRQSSLNSDRELVADWSKLLERAQANTRLTPLVRDIVEILERLQGEVDQETAGEAQKAIEDIGMSRNSFETYVKRLFNIYRTALDQVNACVNSERHFVGYHLEKGLLWNRLEEGINAMSSYSGEIMDNMRKTAEAVPERDARTRAPILAAMKLWSWTSRAFQYHLCVAVQTAATIGWRFETEMEDGDIAGAFAKWNWWEIKKQMRDHYLECYDGLLKAVITALQAHHKLRELYETGLVLQKILEDTDFVRELGAY